MLIAFTLRMPSVGSWNGQWSGQGLVYAIVKSYQGKRVEAAKKLIGSHRYAWSDGWAASISVTEVDRKEAARLRRKSDGFCGYEWMVESLETHGDIRAEASDKEGNHIGWFMSGDKFVPLEETQEVPA